MEKSPGTTHSHQPPIDLDAHIDPGFSILRPFEYQFRMGKKEKAPAYVLGVGMTKFIKPRGKVDYTELGFEVCIHR